MGIARSLAVEPEIWFLDEPFSALDPLIRRQMQDEFVRLQTMLNKTIVFITHDFLEALKIADRIAIMKDGQIVQIGTAAGIVLNPATEYVAEFTEDVPLVRVITCGSIMVPAEGDIDRSITVKPDTTLEDLLPSFADRESPVAVVDDGDRVIGMVTPGGVIQALAEGRSAGASAISEHASPSRGVTPRLPEGFAPWLAVGALVVGCFALVDVAPWLKAYPKEWGRTVHRLGECRDGLVRREFPLALPRDRLDSRLADDRRRHRAGMAAVAGDHGAGRHSRAPCRRLGGSRYSPRSRSATW